MSAVPYVGTLWGTTVATRVSTNTTASTISDAFCLEIQHGYAARPWPGISQSLWFSVQYTELGQLHPSPIIYLWIEHASGQIEVVRTCGFFTDPELLIPSLSRAGDIHSRRSTPEHRIRSGWLLPPNFSAEKLDGAPLTPTNAFVNNTIEEAIASLIGTWNLPIRTRTILETLIKTSDSIPQLGEQVAAVLVDGQSFQKRLDNDILALFIRPPARESGIPGADDYNAIAAWKGQQRRNRIQAMAAFPWLRLEWPTMSQDILEAIDEGKPLVHRLARHYDVHPYTIRRACRLLRLHYPEGSIPALLWLLDSMKPDLQPRGFKDLERLLLAHQWICNWQLHTDASFMRRLSAQLFGDGLKGAEQLFRRWCPSHNPSDPYHDLQDFFVDRGIYYGYGPDAGELYGDMFKDMVLSVGLQSVFAASEQWHIGLMLESTHKEFSWSPILPFPVPAGDLIAHELCNTAMLFEEGAAMRHCIASYASFCVDGTGFIFSLRTTGGKRRSTLYIKRRGEQFSIDEHRSFVNGDPDYQSLKAADLLIEQLQDKGRIHCQSRNSALQGTIRSNGEPYT